MNNNNIMLLDFRYILKIKDIIKRLNENIMSQVQIKLITFIASSSLQIHVYNKPNNSREYSRLMSSNHPRNLWNGEIN